MFQKKVEVLLSLPEKKVAKSIIFFKVDGSRICQRVLFLSKSEIADFWGLHWWFNVEKFLNDFVVFDQFRFSMFCACLTMILRLGIRQFPGQKFYGKRCSG